MCPPKHAGGATQFQMQWETTKEYPMKAVKQKANFAISSEDLLQFSFLDEIRDLFKYNMDDLTKSIVKQS